MSDDDGAKPPIPLSVWGFGVCAGLAGLSTTIGLIGTLQSGKADAPLAWDGAAEALAKLPSSEGWLALGLLVLLLLPIARNVGWVIDKSGPRGAILVETAVLLALLGWTLLPS